MDLNFGINGSITAQAARPIIVKSTTVIALLGIVLAGDEEHHGLHKFNNADDALTFLTDEGIGGDIEKGLKAIALQGVHCPIVLNLCADADKLTALDLFKSCEGITGLSLFGGLLIAPVLSAELVVGTKLDALATQLQATAIIDNFGVDEAEVSAYAANYGTQAALLTHGRYYADGVSVTASALYAGIIAYWDAKPYGWAKSHSNRSAKGVSESERVIEYLDGSESEARRYRQMGVATILRDVGWRTYGFETTHIDPIWQSLDRVRTFQRLLRAITLSAKWARDREANELLSVKNSVIEFMNELKGNDVIIGFDVFFDSEKNTKATVTAGKFYLTILVGDMTSVRELNIELVYSDNWNDVLINTINGAE